MNTQYVIALFLIGMGIYSINTNAAYVSGDAPPYIPPPSDPQTIIDAISEVSMQSDAQGRVDALLEVIGRFESNGDYYILYGGGHFTDDSAHPNVHVPFYNPRRSGPKGVPNDYSTAAGKYQINYPTYQQYAPRLGVTDFTPATQDQLAYMILNDIGADVAVANGDVASAFQLASRKWASMPGSTAGQNPQALQVALDTYQQYLTAQG
jgi:muramidase (phage lysozyme)